MTQTQGENSNQEFSYPQEIINQVEKYLGNGSAAHIAAVSGSPDLLLHLLFAAGTTFTSRELLIAGGQWEREQVKPGERERIVAKAWKGRFITTLADKVGKFLDEKAPGLMSPSS